MPEFVGRPEFKYRDKISHSFFIRSARRHGKCLLRFRNRKVGHTQNPMIFTVTVMAVSLTLYFICYLMFGTKGTGEFFRKIFSGAFSAAAECS